MSVLRVYVEGIGLWSPELADFAALRSLLDGGPLAAPTPRPPASVLPPNERRRAPASVLLAAEVAAQAVAMSRHEAAELACVFASAHGDQAITDDMCATLARAPGELSPTRFHNSVHNAAVGYWTIATHCHAPSTAVAAQRASFGAGLLEAAAQVLAERRPVLLACSDVTGVGPLRTVTGCDAPFGCALVLAPERGERSLAQLDLQLIEPQPDTALAEPLASWREHNPSAPALALLVDLARDGGRCQLAASPTLGLQVTTENLA
ncbi:MAG: beta-ketoacyl synthase chain length factor [Rhodanobacter sp.]